MSTDSFFDLPPELTDPQTARFLIVPIPYDGTASFLKGTCRGPAAILRVANQIEHVDDETLCEYWRDGIAVLPEVPPQETPAAETNLIEKTLREYQQRYTIFGCDKLPIILGGEHSVTPPVVAVVASAVPDLSVLQFDAHSDLRNEYTGTRHSHASAMRRVIDVLPPPQRLVQVGIRSFSAEELREHPQRIAARITPADLEDNFVASLEKILAGLSRKVYITIDIDAFDPAFAPGTGTPEPGGLTWRQVTRILRAVIASRHVIGCDVVEVSPRGSNDSSNDIVTEYLAARLVSKIMAYTAAKTI